MKNRLEIRKAVNPDCNSEKSFGFYSSNNFEDYILEKEILQTFDGKFKLEQLVRISLPKLLIKSKEYKNEKSNSCLQI
jgi:hypothetical protein